MKPVTRPPAPLEEDLPVVETVGFEQTAKGWVVVVCKVRGSKVFDKEIVGAPSGRHFAVELLKITVARRLILGLKG